ncbi:MAG: methyltransferase domain-containing protein [Steroidobacteraceae bacterium]
MNGPISSAVLPLLRCPRCAGVLEGDSTLSCSACGVRYPLVDGMPWLLPAPDLALAEWRGRLHAMTTHLKRQAAQYRAALRPDVTRPTTRSRLKLLAMACSDHARRLQALLAPLEAEAEPAAAATYAALAPVVAAAQGLASYYPNVHRDWVWGAEENQAALAAVRRALGSVRPERLLVLGSGAGRLSYDLHAILRPAATIAVDINPLLMAVARRMYAAERVDLYEFPVAPRDLASHALLRALTAPARAEPGLHLVFGDVKQPPFAPGSFDAVVTPWLVDVVDTELESLAATVNSLLAPGGRWVCTGTLFFQQADPANAYSSEEVQEIVAGAGFESPQLQASSQPYLASPASRHARVEEVVTFAVHKQREAELPLRPLLPWLADPRHPVPLLPEVADHALALRVRGYVASLVDGRRSMSDIAAKLVEERLLPQAEATGIVRDYLQRLHDEAQLRQGI